MESDFSLFEWWFVKKPTDKLCVMKQTDNEKKVKWKCRRCGAIVDMVAFRCKCEISPSPWEPINNE